MTTGVAATGFPARTRQLAVSLMFPSKMTFLWLLFFFFFFVLADVESAFRSDANTDALPLDRPVSLLFKMLFGTEGFETHNHDFSP